MPKVDKRALADGTQGEPEMTRYWISWWQPGDDPRPLHYPPKDERVLGWWRSASDGKRTSICALVAADVSDTALAAVAQDWPESLDADVRFVDPKPADWTPGDRFPLEGWMKQRIDAHGVNPSDQTKQEKAR